MTDISPARSNIQIEEVRYRAAVSEGTFTRIGSSINHINTFQYDTKSFFLNGDYAISVAIGSTIGVDGLYVIPFNCEVFQVAMFNLVAGSSGTTTLDVKRATASGGAFTTIFSTTPKIQSTAGNNAYIRTGGAGVGLTAPILTTTPFQLSAGHALRLDIIGVQGGTPQNCGLILYMRPT